MQRLRLTKMDNKRSDLRKHFIDKANQAETAKSFADLSERIASSEETTANAFQALLNLIDGKITKTEVINQLTSISTPDVAKVVQAIVSADKDKLTAKDLKGLETSFNKAVRELSLIPKSHAKFEQRETVKVTNLSELKQDNSDIIKAIEKLDIKPVVDIKAPIVNVEKTDIKPLIDLTRDVLKATTANKPIKAEKFPEIPVTDLSKVEKKLDESNKHLKTISEKKFGGSGGGGNGSPYIDSTGKIVNVELVNGKIPVDVDMATEGIATEATLAKTVKTMFTGNVSITKTVASPLTTFVKTGTTNTAFNTQTIVINSTTGGITKVWSTV